MNSDKFLEFLNECLLKIIDYIIRFSERFAEGIFEGVNDIV